MGSTNFLPRGEMDTIGRAEVWRRWERLRLRLARIGDGMQACPTAGWMVGLAVLSWRWGLVVVISLGRTPSNRNSGTDAENVSPKLEDAEKREMGRWGRLECMVQQIQHTHTQHGSGHDAGPAGWMGDPSLTPTGTDSAAPTTHGLGTDILALRRT